MRLTMNIRGVRDLYGEEKTAKYVKAAGFDAADYCLCNMADAKHIFNSDKYAEEAARIRAIYEGEGLPIVQTHTPFWFSDWENEEHFGGFIMPVMKRSIEVSALLGADVAVVHPVHYMRYEGREEEIFEINMWYYRELIPIAERFGIKIAVENMFQMDERRWIHIHDTCSKSEEFIRYVDSLDSDSIVACLDIGHAGLPSGGKEEPWDFVRALGHSRLHSLHVHDNDYRGDAHQLPFMGKIDWNEVTRALGEIDYDGDFTYEINSKWVGERLKHVGEDFAVGELTYMASVGRHLMNKIDNSRP